MNPQNGSLVKILFRNNVEIEGFVELWSDKKSIIRCKNNNNFYIIQKTADDIIAVLVMQEPNPVEIKEELEEEFTDTYNQPSDIVPEDLRTQKLVQLRKLLIKQDKRIVEEKLKEHVAPGTYGVKYGVPGFLEIKSPK